MRQLLEDFLSYVKVNTRSDEKSTFIPTTPGQIDLALQLKEQLEQLGLSNVAYFEKNSFVIGALKGNAAKPAIGFIAHVDTADFNAENIQAQVHYNYDGNEVVLNAAQNIVLSPSQFPNLKDYVGQTLITTDGTTLLGADDKAGIAEIMAALRNLKEVPKEKRGDVWVAFGPDEEIGRGADNFEVADFPVDFAYTIDSGRIGHFEYETFNAAKIEITIEGTSVHPGTAYGQLVNAIKIGETIDSRLPQAEVPELTQDYEGFYLLNKFSGDISLAQLDYIIRDHDQAKFIARKNQIVAIIDALNATFTYPRITYRLFDQYYNMKEIVDKEPRAVDYALLALKNLGIKPIVTPFRGGTDGSKISYKGIATPNLFTGGENFHGPYEFITLEAMEKARDTIVEIVKVVGEAK
ncbi:peptidase T [Enterococcus canintestini]|uniref:peptidase T n=1 Tax=Enterococcus canintestini TaxID=317010 RepID=UPI00288F8803|nr:peptidase T [Enterococcus canintestini]MDT2739962.1 peptidase T [Enterococcus canintestini]